MIVSIQKRTHRGGAEGAEQSEKKIRAVIGYEPSVVVHFQSAMSLNVEKDSSLPLGMTTKNKHLSSRTK